MGGCSCSSSLLSVFIPISSRGHVHSYAVSMGMGVLCVAAGLPVGSTGTVSPIVASTRRARCQESQEQSALSMALFRAAFVLKSDVFHVPSDRHAIVRAGQRRAIPGCMQVFVDSDTRQPPKPKPALASSSRRRHQSGYDAHGPLTPLASHTLDSGAATRQQRA